MYAKLVLLPINCAFLPLVYLFSRMISLARSRAPSATPWPGLPLATSEVTIMTGDITITTSIETGSHQHVPGDTLTQRPGLTARRGFRPAGRSSTGASGAAPATGGGRGAGRTGGTAGNSRGPANFGWTGGGRVRLENPASCSFNPDTPQLQAGGQVLVPPPRKIVPSANDARLYV